MIKLGQINFGNGMYLVNQEIMTSYLFSELIFLNADQHKAENNSRNLPYVTGERYFNATPLFYQDVKREKIEEPSKTRETYGLKTDFAATLIDNNLE